MPTTLLSSSHVKHSLSSSYLPFFISPFLNWIHCSYSLSFKGYILTFPYLNHFRPPCTFFISLIPCSCSYLCFLFQAPSILHSSFSLSNLIPLSHPPFPCSMSVSPTFTLLNTSHPSNCSPHLLLFHFIRPSSMPSIPPFPSSSPHPSKFFFFFFWALRLPWMSNSVTS